MRQHDASSSPWITRAESAGYLRISLSTFDRRRKEGKYRPSGSSSSGRPLWRVADLDAELGFSERRDDPIMALIDGD